MYRISMRFGGRGWELRFKKLELLDGGGGRGGESCFIGYIELILRRVLSKGKGMMCIELRFWSVLVEVTRLEDICIFI